jgi:hypothetical protein
MKKVSIFVFFIMAAIIFLSIASFELLNISPQSAMAIEEDQGDKVSINTKNPQAKNYTVFTKSISVNDTASYSDSSIIRKMKPLLNNIPLGGTTYKSAIPTWSSLQVFLRQAGPYLTKSTITDNASNQNWTDPTIHYPQYTYNKKVSFVEPTFTYAAYSNASFYNFYKKYHTILDDNINRTITTDINLLKNRPVPHGPFPYFAHAQRLSIPYRDYFNILQQHVKYIVPFVTNLTDADVHEGRIFTTDGRNAYDVLFLFHNEYVTELEYENLKQFVSNGGTIVFSEADILTTEVSYNKTNDSITLVKGHSWKFNGKGATPSIHERWLNESKDWIGSNFFAVPSYYKVYFRNNPFNYTHSEEQYVSSPNAKILINYETSYSSKQYPNATIATYYMDYGKGRIINLGIWGHTLVNNKPFLNYLDTTIIPFAFDQLYSIFQKMVSLDANVKDDTFTSYFYTYTHHKAH